jgi:prolipoprotein diacylglyceryl transferase
MIAASGTHLPALKLEKPRMNPTTTADAAHAFVWDVAPYIVRFGGFELRWYSLLFAVGFGIGYYFMLRMFQKDGRSVEVLDSLLFHLVLGTIIGARLGHCLLYEPETYLTNPIRILKVWEGGLASHGGFAGVVIAIILFCRKHPDLPFFWLADRLSMPTLMVAGFIRTGNLFNSEIIGHPTNVPWAVIFKRVDMIPRHPTQVYEALGYFTIALIVTAVYKWKERKPPEGMLLGLGFALGFTFRMFIEHFKENQVDFENGMLLNMGQLLSIPFVLIGVAMVMGVHARFPFFRRFMTGGAGFRRAVPAAAASGGDDGKLARKGK